ncbi:MAG TPA: CusA/CzcA family heavy metal efflux RND transporter [Haliangiales bacterium]|nr:CusA/CzcA family heavy metal efflux RND transporter [Haliangiales bacterium]
MINRLLESSLRNGALVLFGAGLLLGFGLWAARNLPIDAVPDITSPQIQVNTEVPALAPEEAEKLVTYPIETELAGLPGVTEMRSLTKSGLSQVTLQFDDRVDIFRARQLAMERLQNAKDRLPPNAEPKLAPISTGLGEIFYYTVEYHADATNKPVSRYEQLLELTEIQEFVLKPQLRTVSGVAEVNASGGYERQIVVQPDPVKLRDANLTFSELAEIVEKNTANTGGGFVNRGDKQFILRGVTRAQTAEDIAGLPLKFAGAVKPLLVQDVASVSVGHHPRYGAATVNGQEAVIGTTMMMAGQNSRVVAKRVAARLEHINKNLPAGIELKPVYDRAELVDRTVRTVRTNLFEGAVLVVVVLLALLGNWRAAVIVAMAIPLSFLCALIGMARLGVSGNLMSLGAVDFGLIIDGAVVIVENILRELVEKQQRLGRKLTKEERFATVLTASKQVGNPMFFGVLIITVVYVPILALTGIEGKMFHPMAITVMLALGGALVLALTLMPALAFLLLRSVAHGTGELSDDNFLIRFAKKLYSPTLNAALRARWIVVVGAVALFAVAVVVFQRLGAEFVPKLDEGSSTMMIYHPVGLSLEESLRRQFRTDSMVRETFPEIARVFSRIGTSEVASDPMPPNETDFYVSYHPRSQWRAINGRVPTKPELARLVGDEIEREFKGTHVLIAQPIEMRFNEMLEGIRADVSVKIFGNDYDVLEKLAEQAKPLLKEIPGASEVEYETEGRAPVLEIKLKRDALTRYNLSAAVVNQTIATALAGQTVGTMLSTENRPHDIVVRLRADLRENLDTLRALPVRVGQHGLIALGDLAEFNSTETVEPIQRDEAHRRAALMVNLKTSDVEGWVRKAEAALKEKIKPPDGYIVEFGGQFEHLQEARARLAIVVPAALLLIFVLIFMAFGSFKQAVLVYTGIPLAVTGGVFALWIRGMPFSITAAVGFIALSGVAVLNGVVLVSCFNQLREQSRTVREAVLEGARTRLRPVLMTAAVASLGFLPMAVSTSLGAEVQRPLATVVIGGVLSSTFLTLVLLPVLYDWVESKAKREAVEPREE